MHDFVLFDGGIKKLPRVHQYFGLKEAQEFMRRREGGIIWHTQGSGKSIVMVLLAKWLLENNPNARIAIVTDRDELDKQIERVFADAGEPIKRTSSGRDLMKQLGQAKPRLLCSLVHKFGRQGVEDFDAFIKELEAKPSPAVGELFVFVDECHRTQSGKLHRTMKALMPNAVFVGFTGTPLLKKDRQTSLEVFGRYIHTYKFSEAVEDEVVLDLVYEAPDIDQRLGSEDKIDQWFEAKTKGLNEWQKDELRKKWGTMQNVLSSRHRMDRVVSDIIFDFSVKPRLSSERGNAILVASSIFEACRYYTLLQKTPFKGRCALVTSYNPQAQDVTKEETGANTESDKQFIYNTYQELLKGVDAKPGMTKTETYEERAKALFAKEPANMKLLVVVDKLLTGFDAPPCTYLYIDKSMQDHGLFQAICRTNNLDLSQVAAAQNQKEVTINDQAGEIDAALTDDLEVLVDDTNAVTLTAEQFRRAFFLMIADDTLPPDGAITITVPAVQRGLFKTINNTDQGVTVTLSGQSLTAPTVAAGEAALLSCDGSNVRFAGGGGDSEEITQPYDFGFAYPGGPPDADDVLAKVIMPRAMTLPANLAGSAGHIDTNPTAQFDIDVISIADTGAFTFTTDGGAAKAIGAGSVIRFMAPTTPDATAASLAATLVGTLD